MSQAERMEIFQKTTPFTLKSTKKLSLNVGIPLASTIFENDTSDNEILNKVKFSKKSSFRASWQLPIKIELHLWLSTAAKLFIMINYPVWKRKAVSQSVRELSCTQTEKRTAVFPSANKNRY